MVYRAPRPRYEAPVASPASQLADDLGAGEVFPPAIDRALKSVLGRPVSRDGLARLFQPSFPGVKAFVIEPRVAPDRAVEITVVGVARDGRPVVRGHRAFALGRDGSLELHRGFDRIDPGFQHRNITVDLVNRELELLRLCRRGPSTRVTLDAEGVGRYMAALHGFVFADETDDGPPVRSNRPFAPEGDRQNLIEAAIQFLEREARRLGVGRIALESAIDVAREARTAWDLAQLEFPGQPTALAEGGDGRHGTTRLGRSFLLDPETPPWRAALYLDPRDPTAREAGRGYRSMKTRDSSLRLQAEVEDACQLLASRHRPERLRALETLSMVGSPEHRAKVAPLVEGTDRRVAGAARRAIRALEGEEIVSRMLGFSEDAREELGRRGRVLRVLSEHFPARLDPRSNLLRVHPDARIQRAVVPLVADAPQGSAELAAMLAANPAGEAREGLAELRLELMERLAESADPLTLPVLLEQYRRAGGDPTETLALSRALVAFADPRARLALAEAVRASERPPLP